MKITILAPRNEFTDAFAEQITAKLDGDVVQRAEPQGPPPANDTEVLLIVGKVTRELLEQLPKLELVQTLSTGYEGVDVEAACELGVWVSYPPSKATGNAASVGEHAVLLMLGASRHIKTVLASLTDPAVKPPTMTRALKGKSVLIVGLGDVGLEVADRLQGWGMTVSALDRHPQHAPSGIPTRDLTDILESLATADYVVLCLRADEHNRHMFDAKMLAAMKRGSILINVARGSLVDEAALLKAVENGHLAAAGLDVLEEEPVNPKNPLLTQKEIFITPHIAGFTDLNLEGTVAFVEEALGRFRRGVRLESALDEPQTPRRRLDGR